MAVVQYKCSVCKREIDVIENLRGLDIMDRCIITKGCRGDLYRIKRKLDFIRGEFPSRVAGLEDYTQRRVLYNHYQTISAREWYVEHNLGVAPSVQVLTNKIPPEVLEPSETPCEDIPVENNFIQVETTDFDIEITSPNTLTITFPDAEFGLAQMIARSSAAKVYEEVTSEIIPVRLTNNDSLLTVATLNTVYNKEISVSLEISYYPPGKLTPVVKTYSAPAFSASESPWNDFTNVLIQGRQYKTRSFDIFVSEMSDGTIPDGSSFYISAINGSSYNNRELYILLAQEPYADVDKIVDRLIDANTITADNSDVSLYHENRELYAFPRAIISVFPLLREV